MVNVKGGWELLARFEARAVLGFGDKTPTPQEGELGSGKLALSLIKAGKEEGNGRSELGDARLAAWLLSPVVYIVNTNSQPGGRMYVCTTK